MANPSDTSFQSGSNPPWDITINFNRSVGKELHITNICTWKYDALRLDIVSNITDCSVMDLIKSTQTSEPNRLSLKKIWISDENGDNQLDAQDKVPCSFTLPASVFQWNKLLINIDLTVDIAGIDPMVTFKAPEDRRFCVCHVKIEIGREEILPSAIFSLLKSQLIVMRKKLPLIPTTPQSYEYRYGDLDQTKTFWASATIDNKARNLLLTDYDSLQVFSGDSWEEFKYIVGLEDLIKGELTEPEMIGRKYLDAVFDDMEKAGEKCVVFQINPLPFLVSANIYSVLNAVPFQSIFMAPALDFLYAKDSFLTLINPNTSVFGRAKAYIALQWHCAMFLMDFFGVGPVGGMIAGLALKGPGKVIKAVPKVIDAVLHMKSTLNMLIAGAEKILINVQKLPNFVTINIKKAVAEIEDVINILRKYITELDSLSPIEKDVITREIQAIENAKILPSIEQVPDFFNQTTQHLLPSERSRVFEKWLDLQKLKGRVKPNFILDEALSTEFFSGQGASSQFSPISENIWSLERYDSGVANIDEVIADIDTLVGWRDPTDATANRLIYVFKDKQTAQSANSLIQKAAKSGMPKLGKSIHVLYVDETKPVKTLTRLEVYTKIVPVVDRKEGLKKLMNALNARVQDFQSTKIKPETILDILQESGELTEGGIERFANDFRRSLEGPDKWVTVNVLGPINPLKQNIKLRGQIFEALASKFPLKVGGKTVYVTNLNDFFKVNNFPVVDAVVGHDGWIVSMTTGTGESVWKKLQVLFDVEVDSFGTVVRTTDVKKGKNFTKMLDKLVNENFTTGYDNFITRAKLMVPDECIKPLKAAVRSWINDPIYGPLMEKAVISELSYTH